MQVKAIRDASNFLRTVAWNLRFGALSREPLKLLRLELHENRAECDWIVRPPDPWDVDLPEHLRIENQTFQTLRDAIHMRELVFGTFAQVEQAQLRGFRGEQGSDLELIMAGTVTREDEAPWRMPSLVMRAKLCGLRFLLNDGALQVMS